MNGWSRPSLGALAVIGGVILLVLAAVRSGFPAVKSAHTSRARSSATCANSRNGMHVFARGRLRFPGVKSYRLALRS